MNIFTCISCSDFSLLDGYQTVEEVCQRAPQINQQFCCVTDHGMMGVVPRQIRACEENKLSPIFGCELYVNPLQPEVPYGTTTGDMIKDIDEETKKKMRKSYHLLAIAYNNTGYSNLVRLTSWGFIKGFYYKPRVNHEMLMKHKEGLIFSSCCYMGECGQAFDQGMQQGGETLAEEMGEAILVKYIKMFGPEHFRLEIMLLDFKKQKPYDKFIIKMSQKFGLQLIVTNDCHYCQKEDSQMQRYMLMIQTKRTMQEIKEQQEAAEAKGEVVEFFELQDSNLWMKSEEEINEKWLKDYSDVVDPEIFAQAKLNTVAICEKAKGVTLDRSIKLPKVPDANEKLKELAIQGFAKRGLPKTQEYLDRLKEEYQLVCEKEFSSYFLIQKMMTDEARRYWGAKTGGSGADAVGQGRGSSVGSLLCYCLGITNVNPIRHDLLFSRFLSPARGGKSMKLRFSMNPVAHG